MAYDSPYAVLCRILALLQAFVAQTKPLWDAWAETEKSAAEELGVRHVTIFKRFISDYKEHVNDAIAGIDTPTTLPVVRAAAKFRFERLLRNDVVNLGNDMTNLLKSTPCRVNLLNQMDVLRTCVERICGRMASVEADFMREYGEHREKFLVFCMGSHPRLGKKAYLIRQLSPDLIMAIVRPKYDVSVEDIVRFCDD